MNNDRIIQKIKKCLALSKSSNEHEAAAALRQARLLMDKHRIVVTDVDFVAIEGDKERPPLWKMQLISTVAAAFGCSALLSPNNLPLFAGQAPAPEVAKYAFEVLLRQLNVNKKAFLTKYDGYARSYKVRAGKAFAEGWVYGCKKSVLQFAQPLSQQEDEYNKRQVVEALGAQMTPPRQAKSAISESEFALSAAREGMQQGKQVRLHSGVNTTSGEQILIGNEQA